MMTQAEIDGEYNDQVRHQRAKGNEMRDCGLIANPSTANTANSRISRNAIQSLAWSSRCGGGSVRIITC